MDFNWLLVRRFWAGSIQQAAKLGSIHPNSWPASDPVSLQSVAAKSAARSCKFEKKNIDT
jgi:hypothetical protein